jgi:hypothetical protein
MTPTQLDPELLRYCRTDRQREAVSLVIECGSKAAAARELKMDPGNLGKMIAAVYAHAAKAGYSPEADEAGMAPPGYVVKGKSTYYDAEGKVRGQWVKTREDADKLAAIQQAAVDAACASIQPLAEIAPPSVTSAKLLNVYTVTDYHFNMLAWGRECGQDWDTDIAADTLRKCFAGMVNASPVADTCVIAQLGDFAHSDGFRNVTPTSEHELDVDTRFERAVTLMLEALRGLIEFAAARHSKVVVLLAEGNHDMASSVWFRAAFRMLYAANPRIEVIDSPLPYYALLWGKTLLGWHHGHLSKNDSLPGVFAAQFRSLWGQAERTIIHTGHRHHREVKEHAGAEVYQHPTLAARDAYAARGGWHAMRRAIGITYHREHGEVGSVTITPEMVS